MNCGVEVLKRLNELVDEDLNEVIKKAQDLSGENGLNFYDFVCLLNEKIKCVGVQSLKLISCVPYVAYFGRGKRGHYVLVEEMKPQCIVFDSLKGRRKVSKILFYLFWSKKAIVLEKYLTNML